MNNLHHHLTEVEETAWVLIAILLSVLVLFTYLIWRRVSPEVPRAPQTEEVVQAAVNSESRVVIMRPEITLDSV